MKRKQCIEIQCRTSNASTFEHLGFTTTVAAETSGGPGIRMSRSAVNDEIVSALLVLGFQHQPFTARVVGLDTYTDLLIAADGRDVEAVVTLWGWAEPPVMSTVSGRRSAEQAEKYWRIKFNFESSLIDQEVWA